MALDVFGVLIAFEHNEHPTEKAKAMAKQLGFLNLKLEDPDCAQY